MTPARLPKFLLGVVIALFLSAGAACGYHTSAHGVRLPSDLHTLYVPMFGNTTQAFRVEQTMTSAVVQELHSRSNFRVLTSENESADATLKGTLTYLSAGPLTYDSQTGHISSSLVVLVMKVSLIARDGKVLWENPSYTYREQYQVSRDAPSFFEEESPALLRVSRDFSRSLVSNILEAY